MNHRAWTPTVDKQMRTVLIIAYFFPPLGGIGTQRALKFARYLPQFGWRPVILSVRGSPYSLRDPALMSQVSSDLPVFRARTVEPEHLYNLYRRFLGGRNNALKLASAGNTGDRSSTGSLAARLENWLCIPDGRVGWLPFAVPLGKRILQTEEPSVIFSTSAPYTAHLIARRLAEWSELPWVLDLRDPWVDNHFQPSPTRWHRSLNTWLEGRCIRQADRVVCVTPLMTEEMRLRYADQPADKFSTITNGFDAVDFDPGLAPDPGCFSIRHVGSLYAGRSAIPFLEGLVLALRRNPRLKDVLQVEFIGAMDRLNRQAWEAFVSAHGLKNWVSSREFVPHSQAVRLMQQSQVQLLIVGKGIRTGRIYPAKLFEYLGARRPILAVVPPGVTETLVRELEAGIVADPDDVQSMADAILEFYSWFQQGKLQNWASKGVAAYERRHLTGQLASLLDTLVMERQE
ncbi:MAG: hypothetical protein Kow0063_22360 [Anaerolineae bacterium]